MAIEEIRRETGTVEYRDQIANYVTDLKEYSEQHFQAIRKEMPELYNLYRGTLAGKYAPHRNNVHIPLIFSTIQSDVARKTQASFGSWPAVSFVGYSSEDAPIARKRESLISAQMKDCGSFAKAYDLFLTGDLYGTSVLQWGWTRKDQNMQILSNDILPVTGEPIQMVENRAITMFDGPDWRVWDPLDCFPQPGVRDIPDMTWFNTREYMDLEVVREFSRTGPGGRPIFDPREVARLERESSGAMHAADEYKNWRNLSRNLMDQDARLKERYARVIEIVTYWGRLPSELVTDGIVDRVITIANGKYVLRNRPNPFWNGKKPFLQYSPMPDPHYFYAGGKAEVAKKLQIVANRFTNQQLDALDLFIDPVFFVHSDANLNTDNLFIKPGKWIDIEMPPAEAIMPLIPNLNGIQLGGQMTEVLWRWMQQGLGIVEDTVMGGAGQRQTAREFLGRSEAVATRLLLESRMFEESVLEPMADSFVDMNRQFLSMPKEVFILGQSAKIDPNTKLPIQQRTRETLAGWDLVPNYEARAIGATTRLGRGMRQERLTFLLQAASQNPMAASAINWITFFRDIFRTFEMDNVDELINSPDEREKQMILMNGSATPPQPSEVPGTANSMPAEAGLANMVGQGVM